MSRYKHNKSTKYSPVIVGIGIFISLALMVGIWWFFNREDEVYDYKKSVEIPQENKLMAVDKEKQFANEIEKNKVYQALGKNTSTAGASPLVGQRPLSKKTALTDLENSDDSFKEAVIAVSKDMGEWFEVKDSISKYIVLIHDMSQNQIIAKNRTFLKVSNKNMVSKDAQGLYLADEGYKRYDDFANAVVSINGGSGLDLYVYFKPLFNKVYKGFSYPESYKVEDIFLKAAANVINAPVVEGRIALVKHSIYYKFSDAKLEALSDVEKQMLRMGPENTKKIQAKLRQLVETISILNE